MSRRGYLRLVVVGMFAAAGWMTFSVVHGDPQDERMADLVAIQNAFVRLADEVAPSVVSIKVRRDLKDMHADIDEQNEELRKRFEELMKRMPPAAGSGVIIRADGMILTNEHVIFGAVDDGITVTLHTRREYPARVIGADPRSDLAVLHIDESGLPAAQLGDLNEVHRGHWAIAMGNPFGLAADGHASMSAGIVSNIGRGLPNLDPTRTRFYANLIETDAAINPGNSGGPLLNIRGEVIGINTAISSRSGAHEGVGFAIPMSPAIKYVVRQLIEGTEIEYGYLGVEITSPSHTERIAAGVTRPVGALISGVESEGPADKADLKPHDLITHFDGVEVINHEHLVMVVGATVVGRAVKIKFYRDGKPKETSVTVARRNLGRLKHGEPSWKWRGMVLSELDETVRREHGLKPDEPGLVVLGVVEGTPASRSGFKAGDVVIKIGDVAVSRIAHVRKVRDNFHGDINVVLKGGKIRKLAP